MAATSLEDFLLEWAENRPAMRDHLANKFGFISPEVFKSENKKAGAERRKTIDKLKKKGWTDMEIAEFMELDLKTIQTYLASTEDVSSFMTKKLPEDMNKQAELADLFLEHFALDDPAFRRRLFWRLGFISTEVFHAERIKAERLEAEYKAIVERLKAETEELVKAETKAMRKRLQVEAEAMVERVKAESEAEHQKTIQKLKKKGWPDTEIAEFMELDLKTIQTYIASTEDA